MHSARRSTHQALLGELVLTDDDGQPWPAVELLVPGAALASVLVADADRPVVGRDWVERYPTDVLVAAGVRSGFAIVQVADPDRRRSVVLPDLDDWLDLVGAAGGAVGGNLEPFAALADLDLVDPDRWPPALQLIGGRSGGPSLPRPDGGGSVLHRLVAVPACADRRPGARRLAATGCRTSWSVSTTRCRSTSIRSSRGRSGSGRTWPRRSPTTRRICWTGWPIPLARCRSAWFRRQPTRSSRALAGRDIDLPSGVRTVTGEVIDADDAVVLDLPWLAQLLTPSRVVPGGTDPAWWAGCSTCRSPRSRWTRRC